MSVRIDFKKGYLATRTRRNNNRKVETTTENLTPRKDCYQIRNNLLVYIVFYSIEISKLELISYKTSTEKLDLIKLNISQLMYRF